MIFRLIVLTTSVLLLVGSTAVQSGQSAGSNARSSTQSNGQNNTQGVNTPEHVWRQQGYGKDYRQGHSVNGPLGNIRIWSPATYNAYGAGKSVRFARPVPYTKQPNSQSQIPSRKPNPQNQYGKNQKRDYGQ